MQTWFYRLPPAARELMTAVWVFAALFGVTQLSSLDAGSDLSHNSVAQRLAVAAVVGVLAGFFGVVVGEKGIRRVYGSTDQAITADVSRQSMRWTPVTVAVFAVLAVLNSLDHQWALVALLAAFAIGFLVYQRVLRRRILRLASAIDQRERTAG